MDKGYGTLASLAMLGSLGIIFLGLTSQIRKNFREKRCGFTPILIFFLFWHYATWSIYGWLTDQLQLVGANIPGFLLMLVVLYQFFAYREQRI